MTSIDEDIIATLRVRVAELERHAGLLRDSRAKVCGTLASIHAALDGRPVSEDEPEVVQRVARVVAELAEARRIYPVVEQELDGLRAHMAERITAARAEGARVERERIETAIVDLRDGEEMTDEAEDALCQALAIVRNAEGDLSPAEHAREAARARGEGGPT